MEKQKGYERLKDIVDKGTTHEDYKRVTEFADKYYKMKTGDGIEKLLQQIVTRCTDEEFEQIKRIYRSIIPGALASTELPFKKAVRKNPEVRKLEYGSEKEKRLAQLEEYIGEYWGDKSVDEYLEYAFIDYNYLDPNAFLITEFDEFDPKVEKATPYPFVASSEEAVMFEYKNEVLEFLVVKLPVKYDDNGTERDGEKYTMYLGMDTIVFSQVASRTAIPEKAAEVIELAKKYFAVYYFVPKNEKVPAIRFGFNRDEQTKGRTFVSLFHDVMGFLEKTIKIDSELDLSSAMTAFPQRFMYVTPCKNPACNKGYLPNEQECPICHGTGTQPFQKSTADIITLALPRNAQAGDLVDLNNLLVYKNPPIELLQWQRDYLEYLKTTAWEMMFNVDRFTRSQVSITATESIQGADNLNDTLYPFGRQYSAIWEFVVRDIATYKDIEEGLSVQHKFPKDFKLKGISELMAELKQAREANASPATIAAIEDDINEILYSDRPDDLKEMKIKNAINPFRGYSDENIRFIIAQGNTTKYNRTLWENQEAIYEELELENDDLYDMELKAINEKVKKKTDEYIARIEGEKQADFEKYQQQQAALVPGMGTEAGAEGGETGIQE